MNRPIIILFLLSCIFVTKMRAQFSPTLTSDQKYNIAYIIDSVAMFGNYDQSLRYDQRSIVKRDTVKFVRKNERSAALMHKIDSLYGFRDLKEAIFMYTAPYLSRSKILKQMPQTTAMQIRNDCFYLPNADTVYSGGFVNYNFGIKNTITVGHIKNGKVNGKVITFNNKGVVVKETDYKNGIINGEEKTYNDVGQLQSSGFYKYAIRNGKWQTYYPNGKIKKVAFYTNGYISNAPIEYYSTGKQKYAGLSTQQWSELMKALRKAKRLMRLHQFPLAIKWGEKCIAIDSSFADGYYINAVSHLSMLTLTRSDKKMNRELNTTIELLNKAISIEPTYMEAYRDRAYTRLAKYRFNIVYNGNKLAEKESQLICEDLHQAQLLGDASLQTQNYINRYCK